MFGFTAVAGLFLILLPTFSMKYVISTRKRSRGVSDALSVIGRLCYSGGTEGLVGTLVTVGEGWLQGRDAAGIIAP